MKIYRVLALPAEVEAGALYLMRNVASGQLEAHAVSADGLSVTKTLTKADVEAMIQDLTSIGTVDQLTTARTIQVTGDASWEVSFNGSADVSAVLTLADSGIEPGNNYSVLTVNGKGIVTAGREIDGSDIGRGEADGVAPLDENGLVPSMFLPSYVDDVIEVEAFDQLPGEANDPVTNGLPSKGKIYVVVEAGDTSIYRWSGTAYIEIPSGVGVADSAVKLSAARTITATGDAAWEVSFDGSANVSAALTLAATGVVAAEYAVVTVDDKGRVTAGRALVEGDIPMLTYVTVESAASLYTPSPEW